MNNYGELSSYFSEAQVVNSYFYFYGDIINNL